MSEWSFSTAVFSGTTSSIPFSFMFVSVSAGHVQNEVWRNAPIGVALEDAPPNGTVQVMTRGIMKLKVKGASSKKQGLTKPTNKEWRSIIDA